MKKDSVLKMCEESIWKFIDEGDLTGYSLIIPSVAVGNVGQLACDLLISSLKMKKIASVYSLAIVPVLGYDPYDLKSDNLSTSCEIYKSDSKKIVVVQLRAPLIYKYAREFLQEAVKTFKQKNITELIILTSSFAHEKKYILTSPFRFAANNLCVHKDQAKSLHWVEHKADDEPLRIFGGGFAALLFTICKENLMPCLILYKYCSEGDNIPDAYDMIHYLSKILPVFDEKVDLMSQLSQPVSWKLLFGRPPPQEIY